MCVCISMYIYIYIYVYILVCTYTYTAASSVSDFLSSRDPRARLTSPAAAGMGQSLDVLGTCDGPRLQPPFLLRRSTTPSKQQHISV